MKSTYPTPTRRNLRKSRHWNSNHKINGILVDILGKKRNIAFTELQNKMGLQLVEVTYLCTKIWHILNYMIIIKTHRKESRQTLDSWKKYAKCLTYIHMYLCGDSDIDSLKLETVKYIENTTLLKSYRNAISVVKKLLEVFSYLWHAFIWI